MRAFNLKGAKITCTDASTQDTLLAISLTMAHDFG